MSILQIGIAEGQHRDTAMQMPFQLLQFERSGREEAPPDHIIDNDCGKNEQKNAAEPCEPSAWQGNPTRKGEAGSMIFVLRCACIGG